MKKGIFAMFILVVSMAMVACTSANKSTTNEGAVGENDAFKALEKKRKLKVLVRNLKEFFEDKTLKNSFLFVIIEKKTIKIY